MSAHMHWFRKGLRVHDNPALVAACKGSSHLYAVFVIDPWFADPSKVGTLRYNFLLQALADLNTSLEKLGSRLYVARGKPEEVLPALWKRWDVKKLTYEVDTEPYAVSRDASISTLAADVGVAVESHTSHTLWDVDRYRAKTKDKTPVAYGAFLKTFASLGAVPAAAPALTADAVPNAAKNDGGGASTAEFAVPTLEEMGYPAIKPPQKVLFPGGESVALARLEKEVLLKKQWVCEFEKPKTAPNALSPATTVLSPYLKFGCLSPRVFYHALQDIYKEAKGKHTQPPTSLHGQLLWREFYYYHGVSTKNYGQMRGNPISRQIPWNSDAELLAAWKEGRTGYPFIDAIMTQLKNEGWIHHLARHAVACFLTRGDLWQSWEVGAAVFDEYLLDADWSINNGNWMWLSCSAFFYQYFRCYSPVAFGKKTDPTGEYIKKYLPVLNGYPKKYIYEPWTAPDAVQKAAGCVIGVDYPKPIVDHKIASKANMAKMKLAYSAHKEGKPMPTAAEANAAADAAGGGGASGGGGGAAKRKGSSGGGSITKFLKKTKN